MKKTHNKKTTTHKKTDIHKPSQKNQQQWLINTVAVVLLVIFIGIFLYMARSPNQQPSISMQQAGEALRDIEYQFKNASPLVQGVILEFSDYECPVCQRAYPHIQQMKQQYGQTYPVVTMHFPLPHNPNAYHAAAAAVCAQQQGLFEEYHAHIFANVHNLQQQALRQYAIAVGLDVDLFDACIESGAGASQVQADMQLGQSLGVRGTPSFVLIKNGQVRFIEGFRSVSAIIAEFDEMP
ncbi:MAG: DsbA family protein [Candidatus Woesearchaeota archaeon]